MKKFEAKTLEDAYAQATKEFGCSITELKYEIVQHPSSGILGLFAKPAIIVATKAGSKSSSSDTHLNNNINSSSKTLSSEKDDTSNRVDNADEESENILVQEKTVSEDNHVTIESDEVVDNFFGETKDNDALDASILQQQIEDQLKDLISKSCFDIDIVEVDVIDNTAYIFIDGDDAALLIGKEGYRYNALAYLIYNWLQNRHGLYIKLEIAQFLASQQEMIQNYMEPVIEHVHKEGWGRTRTLDGVLVQIALEQLREEFPNKYVAIKRNQNGDRYVVVSEFNKR